MKGDVTNQTVSITSLGSIMDLINTSSTGLTPFDQTSDTLHSNDTVTQSYPPLLSVDEDHGLSTRVTVAIALGTVVVVIIITIVIVCFVWKKYKEKKKKSWVDNLTLSYIADSNADLTKSRHVTTLRKTLFESSVGKRRKFYIAKSYADLTKDSYDEMISLDNDNFLNSLDTHSFSVFSASGSTNAARQYTYSYF